MAHAPPALIASMDTRLVVDAPDSTAQARIAWDIADISKEPEIFSAVALFSRHADEDEVLE